MSVKEVPQNGLISHLDMKRPAIRGLYGFFLFVAAVMVFVSVVPPLWIMLSSLKDTKEFFTIPPTLIPKSFHPEKLVTIWTKLKFARYTANSLTAVSGCVLCAIGFNGLTAYVLSILKPKGSKVVLSLILWSLMVPATISLVPLFVNIVNLKLNDSFLPLWLSYGANAFWVVLFKSFFDGLPRSYIEAARIDGCSSPMIFLKIVLPLSKAVCGVVAIFAVTASWSEFLLPYLVLKSKSLQTVIVKLYLMRNDGTIPVDFQITALMFATLPPVILFALFQKQITGGIALGGIKG